MDHTSRLRTLKIWTIEIQLACETVHERYGGNPAALDPHLVWHAFSPALHGTSLEEFLYNVFSVLLPAMRMKDDWIDLAVRTEAVFMSLRNLDSSRKFGCPLCY